FFIAFTTVLTTDLIPFQTLVKNDLIALNTVDVTDLINSHLFCIRFNKKDTTELNTLFIPCQIVEKNDFILFHTVKVTCLMLSQVDTKNSLIPFQTVDRKSTRLNSSHVSISYAVFCLKKTRKKERHATYLR